MEQNEVEPVEVDEAEPGAGAFEALCDAAEAGDLPALRQLLGAAHELATATDGTGATPLAYAAERGQVEAVRLLL